MSDPLAGISSRWPDETRFLGQVFNDTAASYKFYWLLGLLTLIQQQKKVFSQIEVVEEMVVAAWHPVCFYRLSLGTQDKLQEAVKELQVEADLDNDARTEAIRPRLVLIRKWTKHLTTLVPTRFLSPWFGQQLRGVDGDERTKRIKGLAGENQNCPYFFESHGADTFIHINESWLRFFNENFEIVRSFVFFHLCRYLQARNPNVPGIVNKLTVPPQRDLSTARAFWRSVRTEFNRMGKGDLFHDIYSDAPLGDAFSIDHFLPWSFVAHDLLWNLAPVTGPTNSKKGDFLPDLKIYLPQLSKLHREAVMTMSNRPKLLEDYANWFMKDIRGIIELREEQFLQQYRESFEPQLQIAHNQGFQGGWVLSS